jgi:hypothetical protein
VDHHRAAADPEGKEKEVSAEGLVQRLIEGDNDDIRDLIYSYLDRPSVEFDIGFAIGTSDGSVIEQNAEEQGIQVRWDVLNEYVSVIERTERAQCDPRAALQ